MRALLWTIAALVAALGLVGFIAWLNYDSPQLGQPIRIAPTDAAHTLLDDLIVGISHRQS